MGAPTPENQRTVPRSGGKRASRWAGRFRVPKRHGTRANAIGRHRARFRPAEPFAPCRAPRTNQRVFQRVCEGRWKAGLVPNPSAILVSSSLQESVPGSATPDLERVLINEQKTVLARCAIECRQPPHCCAGECRDWKENELFNQLVRADHDGHRDGKAKRFCHPIIDDQLKGGGFRCASTTAARARRRSNWTTVTAACRLPITSARRFVSLRCAKLHTCDHGLLQFG